MYLSNDVHSFLFLMDSCFCKVDSRYRTVHYAYYKDILLGSDITFDTFFKKMSESFKIIYSNEIKEDVYKFITKSQSTEYIIFAPSSSGEKKSITIQKCFLEDGHVGVYFDNIESKKNILNLMDPLTETFQKLAFVNRVNTKIMEDGKPYALMVMDIDNFKGINDTYGHAVGDMILREVAKVLKKNIKDGDVGRYGGDEFVCTTYASIEYQDIWTLLYKITHEMYDIGLKFEKEIFVSVTIGLSRYGIDGTNFDELFVKADRALYRGKRKGKDCFIIYDEEKHKNINIDGVKKTNIDEKGSNFSAAILINNIYDLMVRDLGYQNNLISIAEYILPLFSVDRVVVYSNSQDHYEKPLASHYYDSSNETSLFKNKFPIEIWNNHIRNGIISINKVDALENVNYSLYEKLKSENVKSLLRVPLKFSKTEIGSLEISTFRLRDWTVEEKNALITLGNFISVYLYKANENLYIEHKNTIDILTNTLVYSRFVNLIQEDLNESNSKKEIYYLNLGKFKLINDKYGFNVGDAVLKIVAESIRKIFGIKELISRINGDRFIFYRDYTNEATIKESFASLIDNVLYELIPYGDIKEYISILCGVYVSDGTENNPSVMIDNANIARKSEEITKSHITIYSRKINDEYDFRRRLEIDFAQGLNNNEFKIYLQPKVDSRNNKLVGAEVLSRWNYKNERILSPISYIPVLEQSSQIEQLDLYVFEKVCQYLKKLQALNTDLVTVSFNVSRNVANLKKYVDQLEEIRKEASIDPKYIEIEITESMYNDDAKGIVDAIKRLHKFGYKVSMDDFGSGYSNLSSLAECKFDILKIDKSLLKTTENDKNLVIMKTVVELAKNLGASTVCEGVETEEQKNVLKELGCFVCQGYLYDKPLPIDEFTNKYLKKD